MLRRQKGNLRACQDNAESQGMILGEPETVKYVQNCLREHKASGRGGGWLSALMPNRGGLRGRGVLANPDEKPYLHACQTKAQSQGMVLGEPDTVKFVMQCLKDTKPNMTLTPQEVGCVLGNLDCPDTENLTPTKNGGYISKLELHEEEEEKKPNYGLWGMGAVILVLSVLIIKNSRV